MRVTQGSLEVCAARLRRRWPALRILDESVLADGRVVAFDLELTPPHLTGGRKLCYEEGPSLDEVGVVLQDCAALTVCRHLSPASTLATLLAWASEQECAEVEAHASILTDVANRLAAATRTRLTGLTARSLRYELWEVEELVQEQVSLLCAARLGQGRASVDVSGIPRDARNVAEVALGLEEESGGMLRTTPTARVIGALHVRHLARAALQLEGDEFPDAAV